ncbi:MAG: hypothetical protein J2P53_18480, partial [Bradyrhizobiaceae bacterium]|nr:hypothetical protein [Bradyrhizobiaceae bacterium]
MFHLLLRAVSIRSPFVTTPVAGAASLVRAPAFVHIGLAGGAVAVVLTIVLFPPGRFALRELSLAGLSLWGLLGTLAAIVYACCGRSDAGGTRASAATVKRASRAAIVRFVAMQFVVIALLLLVASAALAVFRNT